MSHCLTSCVSRLGVVYSLAVRQVALALRRCKLAKYAGMYVLASCSTVNVAYVKSLGADYVFDYTASDVVGECLAHTRGFGVGLRAGGCRCRAGGTSCRRPAVWVALSAFFLSICQYPVRCSSAGSCRYVTSALLGCTPTPSHAATSDTWWKRA
ncbi:putative oxidoreductase [Trypanosoma cruzi]|uniref:Putative oxidoreductase n=1 Tax=Trypanosoma cruzi TaxID=5693 RepID=A0A2V2UKQ5_TRYCR|nr:putative oxidoreductase [Trypanosoma cruzi]